MVVLLSKQLVEPVVPLSSGRNAASHHAQKRALLARHSGTGKASFSLVSGLFF
jgi:hypothetical protein